MVNPRIFFLGGAFLVLTALGCSHVPRATENGNLKVLWSKISDKSYIRTRGIGVAPAKTRGLTARRGLSRSAALVDARFNLLAMIKGVRVSAGVTVAQLMEKDSLVQELANDVVRGGDEILTEWTADGGAVVTLELKRSTVERLINEKSEREKGLENRIAKDIKEIEDLKRLLALQGFNSADPDLVQAVLTKKNAMASAQVMMEALQARTDSGDRPMLIEMQNAWNAVAAADALDLSELRDSSRKLREYMATPEAKKNARFMHDVELGSHGGGDEWQAKMNEKMGDSPASKDDVRFMSASQLSYYLGR